MSMWGRYVPVHERKQKAMKEAEKQRKKGKILNPIVIKGNKIAIEFWGKKWCEHIESFADYSNRLPRGRTYVRNGCVFHLSIKQGEVEARVSGSELYTVTIKINTLSKAAWEVIKKKCSGLVASILELLQGKISKNVMQIVSDVKEGLFPLPKEITYDCSCPDWADMCKHVAAVLYGIGSRLDDSPDLLFQLRGVDPQELVTSQLHLESENKADVLENDDLAELFGIQLDGDALIGQHNKVSAKTTTISKAAKSSKAHAKKQIITFDLDTVTGSDLKQFRELKKMTVADLARTLAVTSASIYRWESSQHPLKLQQKSKDAFKKLLSLM